MQCDLVSATLTKESLKTTVLNNANLSESNLKNTVFLGAKLVSVNLICVSIINTNFTNVNLIDEDLTNPKWGIWKLIMLFLEELHCIGDMKMEDVRKYQR